MNNFSGRGFSGLAIYGGVIAAVITVSVYCKVKKLSFGVLADTAVPGLILGQIIGRWGNFFNREAFGEYTDSLLAMQLPLDAVRNSDVTDMMRRNIEVIDGINYIQVHPTFLYESLWNVGVLFIMLWWRKYKKFDTLNSHLILLEEAMIYGRMGDIEKAGELFNLYYKKCKNKISPHKAHLEYLEKLAAKLDITLKDR